MILSVQYFVRSETNPEKYYRVVRNIKGQYTCECKNFAIHGKRIGACKHIMEVVDTEIKNDKEDLEHWEQVGARDEMAKDQHEEINYI